MTDATLTYILGWLIGVVIGAISAVVVVLIGRFFSRSAGTRLEMVFGYSGLAGLALMFVGKHLENRALVGASVLLCGWIVLPILLIPPVLIWRCLAWMGHTFRT